MSSAPPRLQWRTLGPPFEEGFKVRTVDHKGAQWVLAKDLARHLGYAHEATGMAKIRELVGPGGLEKVRCARSVDDKMQRGLFEGVVVSTRGFSVIREFILKEGLKPRRVELTLEAKHPPAGQACPPSGIPVEQSHNIAALRKENADLRNRLATIEEAFRKA